MKISALLLALAAGNVWAVEAPPAGPGAAVAPARIAEEAAVKRMIRRAETRPDRVETVRAGGGVYAVSIVRVLEPIDGQDCPAGTRAENTLYVSRPVSGSGGDIHPLRLTAVCRGDRGVRDSLTVNAGWDGSIIEATVYNGSLGLVVHPAPDPAPAGSAPNEPSRLAGFLERLVRQLSR